MKHEQENQVKILISKVLKEQGRKKGTLSVFLGYKESSKTSPLHNIFSGKKIFTTELLNKVSEFLFIPVGYFLTGEKDSLISQINDDIIIQNINALFEKETRQKKMGKKKYQLGELLGGGKDDTAKIQTVNRILQKKRKMSISDMFVIADFFEKPIDWFLIIH